VREICLDVGIGPNILSERLDDLVAILLLHQMSIIPKTNTPCSPRARELVSVVIRKGKDERRFSSGATGREPARLCGSELEMYLGPLVNVTGCDSVCFEETQRWVERDITETVPSSS
jgi:hypothetical protein